jgi:glycerophosphoryl diester phosphodiesterase
MSLPSEWQRRAERPLILGHRGARQHIMENTLEAFEAARQDGADGSELDVQLNRVGVPYFLHDATLTRVTRGADTRRLDELNEHEVQRVTLAGGYRVPSLEAVLDWADQHGQLLNIELKSERGVADPLPLVVADLLRTRSQRPGFPGVLVSSFHPGILRDFRWALPEVPVGLIFEARHARWAHAPFVKQLGIDALHPQSTLLLEPGARAGLALPVNTWTVNDADAAERLGELGVNAIISDDPGQLLRRLG